MAHAAQLLLKACWGAWAAAWLAGWLYNLARGPRTRRRSWEWPAILGAVVLWELLRRSPHTWLYARAWHGPWAEAPGALLLVVSTGFTLWARAVLGRMWSSAPSVKEGHELQTRGPYAMTRHPIYTGMLGMMFGSVLLIGAWWAVAALALFAAYIARKMRVEERLMTETFGDRYAEYRRRTPQIVPGWGSAARRR